MNPVAAWGSAVSVQTPLQLLIKKEQTSEELL